MSATCGGLRVWTVYVPNGRTLDSDHYAYKLNWLAALRAALLASKPTSPPLVVCGDFNIAPTDDDVWDPAAFIGSTHVSAKEREALVALTSLGLDDIHPRAFKGRPFTYWDYRAGNFHKGLGLRIDLALLSRDLANELSECGIDRDYRKGSKPSDHAPLLVALNGEAADAWIPVRRPGQRR